jgi:hypothetical protein
MSVKITVKKRIIVNGKEYESVGDLPPDLRAAYEKGVVARTTPSLTMRVTFNGREYDSLEIMPAGVRRLYETAMAAAANANSPTDNVETAAPAITPSPSVPRWVIVALAAAGMLALTYWLHGRF